jgi:SPP1 gp7 family putative phage head morphogenesis protein
LGHNLRLKGHNENMYPLHLENQYEKFFEKQFAGIAEKLNRKVIGVLQKKVRTDEYVRQDTPSEEIMTFILKLKEQFDEWIDASSLEKQIAHNFNLLDAWSRDKTIEAIKSLLTRLNTPQSSSITGRPTPQGASGELWLTTVNMLSGNTGMTAVLRDRMIKRNLGLIRSLASQHLEDMTRILGDGLTQGKSLKEITDSIELITSVNRNKAKFWATDQAGKFFGEVTKIRQTSAGIQGYIWRTVRDGRVRDEHAALNGKYFTWKKPPPAGPKGEPAHPGETYRCRCWAEPAFGPEYEDKNQTPEDPLIYMKQNSLEQELNQHENVIKYQRAQETLQVFNQNGKLVMLKHGGASRVYVTPAEMRKLNNAVLTHNHPAGWNFAPTDPRHVGNSFSIEDIKTACYGNLSHIRVITPQYRFVMSRPAGGWDKNYFDKVIQPIYNKYEDEVKKEFMNKIEKGDISIEQAIANHFHEIWSRVSRELGIEYIREEI